MLSPLEFLLEHSCSGYCRGSGVNRDEMAYRVRDIIRQPRPDLFLDREIGHGDPFVLPQMVDPRFGYKDLDEK